MKPVTVILNAGVFPYSIVKSSNVAVNGAFVMFAVPVAVVALNT